MNEVKPIPVRKVDYEIGEANGPRDIGSMILSAEELVASDEDIRTVLCCDGSGNDTIVLMDEHGVVRIYEFRVGGEADRGEVEDLIRLGINYAIVVDEGEEIPMIAGASYPRHREEMIFPQWGPTPEGFPEETGGYDCWAYFDGDVYLGPDPHGIYPVFIRACMAGL